MTVLELSKAWSYIKTLSLNEDVNPSKILARIPGIQTSMARATGISTSKINFFLNLLLINNILRFEQPFLFLTENGYQLVHKDGVPVLKLIFKDTLPLDISKEPLQTTFYKIWDIIGNDKDSNPYYTDGKTFYDCIRQFLPNLPPSYSAFYNDRREQDRKLTRFDWGKELFCSLDPDDIPTFLINLQETINQHLDANPQIEEDIADNEINSLFAKVLVTPVAATHQTDPEINLQPNTEVKEKRPKIFISHSSKDNSYARALVNLMIKLGINDQEDIFCSSFKGLGVQFGENFLDVIKNQYLDYEIIVLFIHSSNYYESHISLCEMGAAWVLSTTHFSFLTSNCTLEMLDAVITPKEVAFWAGHEETYHLLNDFRVFLEQSFQLSPISHSRWDDAREEFLSRISQ